MATQTDFMEELRRLPTRSAVVGQVLSILDDPNAGAHEIAQVIQQDPALSLRVMQLANSAYFGGAGTVASIDRAVVAVGMAMLRPVVVISASSSLHDDVMPDGFWEHAVEVAAATARIAGLAGLPTGDALCAGLLHDLGTALLFRWDTENWQARVTTAVTAEDVLTAEHDAYGRNHAQFGAFALETWSLPAALVTAVGDHHANVADVTDRLTLALIAGEAVARAAFPGELATREPASDPEEALWALAQPPASVDELMTRVIEDAAQLGETLAMS